MAICSMAARTQMGVASLNGHAGPPANINITVVPTHTAAILTPQVW